MTLTVGTDPEVRQVAPTSKDVWNLRNGFMILRDGLLVVPECGKLRFLLADPSTNVERKVVGEVDAARVGIADKGKR